MKRILFKDLEKELVYLAKVFGCNPTDILTEEEYIKATQQGYIYI